MALDTILAVAKFLAVVASVKEWEKSIVICKTDSLQDCWISVLLNEVESLFLLMDWLNYSMHIAQHVFVISDVSFQYSCCS